MGSFKEDIAGVKAFVFDVDGVFTDGKIIPIGGNEFIRSYNAKDGFATKYLTSQDFFHVSVITGGKGGMLAERFKALGVNDIYTDCFEKLAALKEFMARYGLTPDEVLFLGDDIPDLECMSHVGLPVCPADAAHEIKLISRYVSGYNGGCGCVRDVIEQVLRAQNRWFPSLSVNAITSA